MFIGRHIKAIPKNIVLISISKVILILCQLISIKLFTTYVNASELGVYFFFLTISYFGNAVIFIPVDYYQQTNLRKIIAETGGIRPFLYLNHVIIKIYLLFCFLCSMVVFIYYEEYIYQLILSFLLSFLIYANQSFRGLLNNIFEYSVVQVNLIFEAALRIIFFLLITYFLYANSLVLLVSWNLALIVSLFFLIRRSKKLNLFTSFSHKIISSKDVFHFAYPVSVGAVANWIQTQGYRLLLVPMGYAEVVGIFSVITNIGSSAMAAVSSIYSQAYMPRIYSTNGGYIGRYLNHAIIIILFIIFLSIIFGEFIIKSVTNIIYAEYSLILLIGVLIEAANFIIAALSVKIAIDGKTREIMRSSFFGLAVLISGFLLTYFLFNINIYSIGIPLVISQFAVVIFMYKSHPIKIK